MKSLLWLMVVISNLAHGAAPGELPDALRGVRPAAGMCARDDLRPSALQQPAGAVTAAVDVSCGVGVRDVVILGANEELTLIDLRGQAAHAQGAIEGSLSMSVAELRTKAFLKSRPVVLVGDGKGQRDLMAACTQLKAQGFTKAKVLLGGLPSWIAEGQSVLGRRDVIDEVPSLTSAELWLEGQFEANLVVIAEPLRRLQQRMPNAVVTADLSPTGLQKVLSQRRKSRAPVVASVVVASPTAHSTLQLAALREALRPVPLLSYTGTEDMFAKDMQRQTAVWSAHARGPKQPGGGL
jgi:rhodanese-related sulfurtransferase